MCLPICTEKTHIKYHTTTFDFLFFLFTDHILQWQYSFFLNLNLFSRQLTLLHCSIHILYFCPFNYHMYISMVFSCGNMFYCLNNPIFFTISIILIQLQCGASIFSFLFIEILMMQCLEWFFISDNCFY